MNTILWLISLFNGLAEMALEILAQEKVWLDKARYADAERIFYEKPGKVTWYFTPYRWV